MITKYIKRHSVTARLTHWTAAISVITLTITGLFVLIQGWNNAVGSDFTIAMRWTHRLIAIPLIVVPLLVIFFDFKGFLRFWRVDIFQKWNRDDVMYGLYFVPYMFFPSKFHMPPQREVKGAQRAADGLLLFSVIIAALSGLILWSRTGFLPEGRWAVEWSASTIVWARVVHVVCFILIAVFGMAHAYLGLGIFTPYRGTVRLMFGDGKVSETDAVYHWGYWADVEITSGKNVVEIEDGRKTPNQ